MKLKPGHIESPLACGNCQPNLLLRAVQVSKTSERARTNTIDPKWLLQCLNDEDDERFRNSLAPVALALAAGHAALHRVNHAFEL